MMMIVVYFLIIRATFECVWQYADEECCFLFSSTVCLVIVQLVSVSGNMQMRIVSFLFNNLVILAT